MFDGSCGPSPKGISVLIKNRNATNGAIVFDISFLTYCYFVDSCSLSIDERRFHNRIYS